MYKIGVTFCGEYREKYVQPFCEALVNKYGFNKDDIFYDAWHEHIINGVHADNKLRRIYNEECEMVVVLLSPNYNTKKWTGNVEWPSVRELINTGKEDKICLLRVDKTNIDDVGGLYSTQDLAKDIDDLSPEDIADFIFKTWNYLQSSKSKKESKDDNINEHDNGYKRKQCIQMIKAQKDDSEVIRCIESMNNNAEKYNLLIDIFGEGYTDKTYIFKLIDSMDNNAYLDKSIRACIKKGLNKLIGYTFSKMTNNKYMCESLKAIYEYDTGMFNELYREAKCFTNNRYFKEMLDWLDDREKE